MDRHSAGARRAAGGRQIKPRVCCCAAYPYPHPRGQFACPHILQLVNFGEQLVSLRRTYASLDDSLANLARSIGKVLAEAAAPHSARLARLAEVQSSHSLPRRPA